MKQVILYIDVNRTLEIVSELKKQGWVINKDFSFAHYQNTWDNMVGDLPKQTIFTFYNDSNASYFMLRWA